MGAEISPAVSPRKASDNTIGITGVQPTPPLTHDRRGERGIGRLDVVRLRLGQQLPGQGLLIHPLLAVRHDLDGLNAHVEQQGGVHPRSSATGWATPT